MDGLCREREVDAVLVAVTRQRQVDALLGIHERIVVRRQNAVDGFEVQVGGAEILEVGAVDSCAVLGFDDTPYGGNQRLGVWVRISSMT